MSKDHDLTVAPLMDGNYAEWEICMEGDLVDKGLWEYVFTEVVKPEWDTNTTKAIVEYEMKMRQARARKIKRVTASQLPHMKDPDLRKVWVELWHMHRAGGFGSKLAMHHRFINAKMKLDNLQEIAKSMMSWIDRVKDMHFKLEAVGAKATDEDIILVLTNGLPSVYDQFIIALNAAWPKDITLKNVIECLANEEGWQGINVIKKEEGKVRLRESALAATNGCCDHSEITRFYCGKKGHFCSECPERKDKMKQTAAVAVTSDELFAF